jgi:hypothetical protein
MRRRGFESESASGLDTPLIRRTLHMGTATRRMGTTAIRHRILIRTQRPFIHMVMAITVACTGDSAVTVGLVIAGITVVYEGRTAGFAAAADSVAAVEPEAAGNQQGGFSLSRVSLIQGARGSKSWPSS